MMKFIDHDGTEYELIEIIDSNFIVNEKKDSKPMPLPFKEGWNSPDSDTIERRYKGIRMADKYYAISKIKTT